MRSVLVGILAAIGCGGEPEVTPVDAAETTDAETTDAPPPDAERRLDPTPGRYREACDGSGAVAIGLAHFLDAYDEDQILRVYARGADAGPVQTIDVGAALGLAAADEADLEELTAHGDRIYAITSHGRTASGQLQRARYRFAALEVSGAVPSLVVTVAGYSTTLLDQMLDRTRWDVPDDGVIATLADASQLGDPMDPDLPPEIDGTTLEGLARAPTPTNPDRLVLGFRNPLPAGRAIVVTLENPGVVITGAPARFGGAALWNLGGLGVRAMAWSETHGAVLIVAGPHAGGGPFRLYRWSGDLAALPVWVADLSAPASSAPEAIVVYPGTRDVQITFDQGDADAGGTPCKLATRLARSFADVIIHVD